MRNILIIICLLTLCSCSKHSHIDEILQNLETEIQSNATQAKETLDSLYKAEPVINTAPNLNAQYILLDTYCNYKSGQEGTNDSLISISENFFKEQGASHELLLAQMLHATILTNAGRNKEAMLKFKEAVENGKMTNDHYLLGQIYTNLFVLCSTVADADQLAYAQKALEEYQQLGDEFYIIDGLMNIGIASIDNAKYEQSLQLFHQAYKKAQQMADTFSLEKCCKYLAETHINIERYDSAYYYYRYSTENYHAQLNSIDYGRLALIFAHWNRQDSTKHYLSQAEKSATDKTAIRRYWKQSALVYQQTGEYKKALEYSLMYQQAADSAYTSRLRNTVMKEQRDYVVTQLDHAQKISYYYLIAAIGLLFIIISATFAFVSYRRNARLKAFYLAKEIEVKNEEQQILEKKLKLKEEELRIKEENRKNILQCVKQSDPVLRFRHALMGKRNITDDDWTDLYNIFSEMLPSFEQVLKADKDISEIEWRVCLLLKLDYKPTEIALLTNRALTSISSINNRLAKKHLGQAGGTKAWLDYIHSL